MRCDIEVDQLKQEEAIKDEPAKLTEQEEADKLGVTVAKFQAMKQYARVLHLSDRKMKTATIRRKVAEKFNLKLT